MVATTFVPNLIGGESLDGRYIENGHDFYTQTWVAVILSLLTNEGDGKDLGLAHYGPTDLLFEGLKNIKNRKLTSNGKKIDKNNIK